MKTDLPKTVKDSETKIGSSHETNILVLQKFSKVYFEHEMDNRKKF